MQRLFFLSSLIKFSFLCTSLLDSIGQNQQHSVNPTREGGAEDLRAVKNGKQDLYSRFHLPEDLEWDYKWDFFRKGVTCHWQTMQVHSYDGGVLWGRSF